MLIFSLFTEEFDETPGAQLMGCKALGFLVQFWFLHAFFWMNVMSYDIYKRFKSCRVKEKQRNIFLRVDKSSKCGQT